MDAEFWHKRWKNNKLGFDQAEANPLLVKYFGELSLAKGSRVFLPLCGKTLDISWLLSEGYRVAGVELSRLAIERLFTDLGKKPKVSQVGKKLEHFAAENIDIFVGDIFNLAGETLGPIDAVYDRAALVALPEKTRRHYAAHLTEITAAAPQLLICYEYDQRLMPGPPFSINGRQIERYYGTVYETKLIALRNMPGGLKEVSRAKESVWQLQKITKKND